MENKVDICVCPNCFSIVKRRTDDVSIRNKNGDRIYFCCKDCKHNYQERQRRLKNLDLL